LNSSQVGIAALKHIREILDKHSSKEERWWSSLSIRERRGLLKLADTHPGFANHEWTDITPAIRLRIIQISLHASQWTNQILEQRGKENE